MRRNYVCLLVLLVATIATVALADAPAATHKPPAVTSSAKPLANATSSKPAAQAGTAIMSPAQAIAAETSDVPAAALQGTPDQLSGWATDHLNAGLWFDRAIAQLRAALAQDPQTPEYHLALGCAEADRAASIAYASSWRTAMGAIESIYPTEIDDWQKGQKDPQSMYYGAPKPTVPAKFDVWTKDDYQKFTLTEAQATARIEGLSKAAKAEWALAVSTSKSPEERANAEYVQGWGLLLLAKTQSAGGMSAMIGSLGDLFAGTNTDAIASLEAATKDQPDNATYWQSVGDALYKNPGLSELVAQFMPGAAGDTPKPGEITALDAYRHALQLDSGNYPIHYQLYELETPNDAAQALADLKLAASGDPDNSYLAYEAAALEFKQSKFAGAFNLMDMIKAGEQAAAKSASKQAPSGGDTTANDDGPMFVTVTPSTAAPGNSDTAASSTANAQSGTIAPSMPSPEDAAKQGDAAYQDDNSRSLAQDAVSLIEQGNSAQEYHPFVYVRAVPKYLAVAWGYGSQVDLDPSGALGTFQLAQSACQYAQAAAKAGDVDDATEAARATIAMGLKMMNGGMDSSQQIAGWGTGAGVVASGYATLEQIYQDAGQQDMANQVKAEAEAFEQQMKSAALQQVQNWMQSFFGSY